MTAATSEWTGLMEATILTSARAARLELARRVVASSSDFRARMAGSAWLMILASEMLCYYTIA
jgi:hypothetical protein